MRGGLTWARPVVLDYCSSPRNAESAASWALPNPLALLENVTKTELETRIEIMYHQVWPTTLRPPSPPKSGERLARIKPPKTHLDLEDSLSAESLNRLLLTSSNLVSPRCSRVWRNDKKEYRIEAPREPHH